MRTITVQMRCMNVDSDGTPMYEGKALVVTTEPKKRAAQNYCPHDRAVGFRAVKYRVRLSKRPVIGGDWSQIVRCRCHGLIRLEK